jgi:hypothetical protein
MKKMVDSVFREDIEYVYGIMYFFCGLAWRSGGPAAAVAAPPSKETIPLPYFILLK